MSKKDVMKLINPDLDVTEELRERVRKARENLSLGPIEAAVPAPRPGFHQHTCNSTPSRLNQMKALGYAHRVDDDGNPVVVEDRQGKKQYVMELPEQLWKDAQALKKKEALNAAAPITRNRKFGDSGEYFSNAGEFSSGTEEFSK